MARAKNAIGAYSREGDAFIQADASFENYAEFAKWVKEKANDGVT